MRPTAAKLHPVFAVVGLNVCWRGQAGLDRTIEVKVCRDDHNQRGMNPPSAQLLRWPTEDDGEFQGCRTATPSITAVDRPMI